MIPTLDGPLPTETHTALAHLYRGEMNRMTVWRSRLDITSNWAIILTTAVTTFTLGAAEVPHYTLLLGLAIIAISILIESRRYMHLHRSKWRLYLLESGYFAEQLEPSGCCVPDWRTKLAEDLRRPRLLVGWLTALRLRLRRNYLLLFYLITGAWLVKLAIHPVRARSFDEFFAHLSVGDLIPPWLVAVTALCFVIGGTVLAVTCPAAEVVEDWSRHLEDT